MFNPPNATVGFTVAATNDNVAGLMVIDPWMIWPTIPASARNDAATGITTNDEIPMVGSTAPVTIDAGPGVIITDP
jgi:hypothetical protein